MIALDAVDQSPAFIIGSGVAASLSGLTTYRGSVLNLGGVVTLTNLTATEGHVPASAMRNGTRSATAATRNVSRR